MCQLDLGNNFTVCITNTLGNLMIRSLLFNLISTKNPKYKRIINFIEIYFEYQ